MREQATNPQPLPRHRIHQLLFVLLLAMAVAITVQTVFFDHRPRVDLGVFMTAGNEVLAGRDPYDIAGPAFDTYVYPQAFAWLVAVPLAALGPEYAEPVWGWCGIAFLAVSLISVLGFVKKLTDSAEAIGTEWQGAAILATAVVFSFPPIWFGWRIGQADLLITAILSAMFFCSDGKRPWVAGVVLGLATILKVSPLIILPALVLAFGWRCVAGFSVVVAIYLAIVAGTGHWQREVYFFTERVDYWKFSDKFPTCSLAHLLGARLFPGLGARTGYYESWLTTSLTAVLLAAYAASGLLLWKRRAPWYFQLFLGIAFSHLVSPFFEPQHATLLILPLAFLAFQAEVLRDRKAALWCAAVWLPGMAFESGYNFGASGWSGYLLLVSDAALIAWALACGRVTRADKP